MNDKAKILRDYGRMCVSTRCRVCLLNSYHNGTGSLCQAFIQEHPEKAVEIIEAWAKEHPERTYLTDFREKFPKVALNSRGIPMVCAKSIYGNRDRCDGMCEDCWNQPMEESK